MLTDINQGTLDKMRFLVGDSKTLNNLPMIAPIVPFDDAVVDCLSDISHTLMKSSEAKAYSDIITFAFWIRKASVLRLKERFLKDYGQLRLGKGVAFHIAPSNVPVNFAYSMVSGLLCGNANIVRVPTKDFEQVRILAETICSVLKTHPSIRPYIVLVQYGHDRPVNDLLSSMADVRIIWGGDRTIEEIRRSSLPTRSGEITFADRYSFAVIDSDTYMDLEDKEKVAEGFYNDTFFSDQNACTSPRLIVWIGNHREEAKIIFWEMIHTLVKNKYSFQDIQFVNKLVKSCLVAVKEPGAHIMQHSDNLIIRVAVPRLDGLIDLRENGGFFYEYDCDNLMELKILCADKRCQTLSYIGEKEKFLPLIKSGIKGIDRVVPIGKTMDFDLIWDGYDLSALLTRVVTVE